MTAGPIEIQERRGQIEGEDLVLQARAQIRTLATEAIEVNVAAINSTKTSLPTKMALAEDTRKSELLDMFGSLSCYLVYLGVYPATGHFWDPTLLLGMSGTLP